MDAEAHGRVSFLTRSAIVVTSTLTDILLNYPLWVYAKRIQAALGAPKLGEVYKGAGALFFCCGPQLTVQDYSTGAILKLLDNSTNAAHAVSACASGAIGALAVGSQVERVITRAHASSLSVASVIRTTYAAEGLAGLIAPYGGLMVAAREVPYAGTLFFLSGFLNAQLRSGLLSTDERGPHLGLDVLTALCSAAIAGPISHAPSVIASHQQARGVTILAACREIAATGGWRSFFRGLVPRTLTLAGTLFVIPFTIRELQPLIESKDFL